MTNKERNKLVAEMEANLLRSGYADKEGNFDVDTWLNDSKCEFDCISFPSICRTSSTGNHLQANAKQLIRLGGYPTKVIDKMKILFDKDDYQGVLDVAVRFDSFIRWAEMMGNQKQKYLDMLEHDPDYVPDYENRAIDMDGEI